LRAAIGCLSPLLHEPFFTPKSQGWQTISVEEWTEAIAGRSKPPGARAEAVAAACRHRSAHFFEPPSSFGQVLAEEGLSGVSFLLGCALPLRMFGSVRKHGQNDGAAWGRQGKKRRPKLGPKPTRACSRALLREALVRSRLARGSSFP